MSLENGFSLALYILNVAGILSMARFFLQRVQRFFSPQLPSVACEVTDRYVSVVRLNARNRQDVERFALVPAPAGLVTPSLMAPMISSVADFQEIVKAAFQKADIKTNRISLAIPDIAARVSLHCLENFAGNDSEKKELLRWKLKKTLPFNIEEAQLSFWEHKGPEGKHMVVAVCVFREILEQLEGALEKLGLRVGYVTLASMASFEVLARMEPASLQQTILFLTLRPSDVSSLILERGALVFFRQNNDVIEYFGAMDAEEQLQESLLQQLNDEIHPCMMYYQDKFGTSGMDTICLASPVPLSAKTLSALAEQTGTKVICMDPLKYFHCQDRSSLQTVKQTLIPSLGLALGKY
jgi:type IV pilus assembly protein PilM